MSIDNYDSLRSAVLSSNDGNPILEELESNLPQGYELVREVPTIKVGIDMVYYIKTPTDKIQLSVSEDGKKANTLHVFEQDKLEIQPSLPNDELAKLALELSKTEVVSMQVFASKNDLLGK